MAMNKKIFGFIVSLVLAGNAHAAFTSCGAGYILSSHAKIDGINAEECVKLWCMDLETGKTMGKNNTANSGYKATSAARELCDARGNCIECFGERKWCGGETPGVWNAEYGAYTRNGADNATYQSYLKGGCFAWRLEKPSCPDGQVAVLTGGEWHCAISTGGGNINRAASIRRTGAIRKK